MNGGDFLPKDEDEDIFGNDDEDEDLKDLEEIELDESDEVDESEYDLEDDFN